MAQTVYRIGEEGVETPITIPSFSEPSLGYTVNVATNSCNCARYVHHGHCVKHVVLAEAILAVREAGVYSERFLAEVIEEELFDLCRRIFAPRGKNEGPADTYNLIYDVRRFWWATEKMEYWALARHKKMLTVTEAA